MTAGSTARDVAAAWQPQRPGKRFVHDIPNAIVEPEWGGARTVAALTPDEAALFRDGAELTVARELVQALVTGFTALEAIVEGHVTTAALKSDRGAVPSPPEVERPALLVPRWIRRRSPARRDAAARDREIRLARQEQATLDSLASGERHAFVATDLLLLDGQPLDDVPLLERKRLLEAVLAVSDLVRVSAFVRPSSTDVLASWGALGFTELSYRGSNSRYLAGRENPDWAIGAAPRSAREPAAATRRQP